MSGLGGSFGFDVIDNPLTHSPFDTTFDNLLPPAGDMFGLVTEGGTLILTEDGVNITTE